MRPIYSVIFALLTGIAVLWLTAPDVVAKLVPGLPHNELTVSITKYEQRVHFSHYATGTAWLIWIAFLLTGRWMKRWGRAMLGIGVPVGILGTLPLVGVSKLGGSSVARVAHGGNWIDALLIVGAVLVLASKVLICFYWWELAVARIGK